MNKLTRLISIALIALFAVGLVACKKEAPAKAEAPPVAKPANEDPAAWEAYVRDVVTRNVEPGTSPYLYYVPGPSTADTTACRKSSTATSPVAPPATTSCLLSRRRPRPSSPT